MFALETSSQGVIYPDRLSSAIVLGEAHDAAGGNETGDGLRLKVESKFRAYVLDVM